MEYKIGICDDCKEDRDYTESLVRSWATESSYGITVEQFPSAEAFLFRYEDEKNYDILLLDIEMAHMNGVELARKIRAVNREVQIVFLSGYDDYIADGYDVEALHYILKPVGRDKLFRVLDRACEKLKKNGAVLFFDLPDGMIRIPLYEIRWLEVRANYVTLHTDREITVKESLSRLEAKLDDGFFRVGRSFVVNLRYVRKVTKTDVYLEGGTAVPLSRGLYEPLNRALIRYF